MTCLKSPLVLGGPELELCLWRDFVSNEERATGGLCDSDSRKHRQGDGEEASPGCASKQFLLRALGTLSHWVLCETAWVTPQRWFHLAGRLGYHHPDSHGLSAAGLHGGACSCQDPAVKSLSEHMVIWEGGWVGTEPDSPGLLSPGLFLPYVAPGGLTNKSHLQDIYPPGLKPPCLAKQ